MINYFVKMDSVVPVLAESEGEAKLKAVNEFMKLIVNDTADYAVNDSSKDSDNDYEDLYLSADDVKTAHKCLLDSLKALSKILCR